MNMQPAALAMLMVTALATGALAQADPACTCRGNGQDVPLGQTICLKTATGGKLARCETTLNNTSWKILEDSCPLTRTKAPLSPVREG